MDIISEAAKGLGNLDKDKRREIYRDLRSRLGLSETEPMIPLPPAELAAWCREFGVLLAAEMGKYAALAPIANPAILEPGIVVYGKPADDAFLDMELANSGGLRDAGFSGIYIHAILNVMGIDCARKAARATLSPASIAIVEERYPVVMLLRHAIGQEAFLGLSAVKAGG